MSVTAYMPVYQNSDGSVRVIEADPMPASLTDGYTFRVELDLPNDDLDTEDGYRVWVRPLVYEYPSDLPDGATGAYWYDPSGVLVPTASDLLRGGWLGYLDSDDVFHGLESGTVSTWRVTVNRWDADGGEDGTGENLDYLTDSFDHLVEVQ